MNRKEEILKEIDLWLTNKHISKKCSQCNSEDCELNNSFLLMYASDFNNIPPIPKFGEGSTLVTLCCLNCAFVRFFSANAMGVVPTNET